MKPELNSISFSELEKGRLFYDRSGNLCKKLDSRKIRILRNQSGCLKKVTTSSYFGFVRIRC